MAWPSLLFIEFGGTTGERAHHSLFRLHGVHSSNGAAPAAKSIDLGRRLTTGDQLTTIVETGEESHKTFSRCFRYRHGQHQTQVQMSPRP